MRKVDKEVLVPWVYAMLGQVLRAGIVEKVVEGCDDRIVKDFGNGEFAWGIKSSVDADGEEDC